RDFANRPEGFAYLATAIERGSHTRSYLSLECLGGKCPKTRQSAVGPQESCPVELVWSQDRPRFRNFRPARRGDGHRVLERDRVGVAPQRHPDNSSYFSSTLAPAASSFFWMSSASALEAPSLMAFGADSTSALASPRPRPVMARTSLMTLILFSPKEARITSNSVLSSAAAAGAPPPAAATATGAAAETPHFSSSIFESSEASRTVSADRSSTILARSAILFHSQFDFVQFEPWRSRGTGLYAYAALPLSA